MSPLSGSGDRELSRDGRPGEDGRPGREEGEGCGDPPRHHRDALRGQLCRSTGGGGWRQAPRGQIKQLYLFILLFLNLFKPLNRRRLGHQAGANGRCEGAPRRHAPRLRGDREDRGNPGLCGPFPLKAAPRPARVVPASPTRWRPTSANVSRWNCCIMETHRCVLLSLRGLQLCPSRFS